MAESSATTPDHLAAWVALHLDASNAAIAELLTGVASPTGTSDSAASSSAASSSATSRTDTSRTVANTLAPYDRAIAELGIAGSEAYLIKAVSPEKAVRDRAEELVQKVNEAAVKLSLNQQVYQALSAIDDSLADPATRHYLKRQLLQYRLAGVDRDDATRLRIQRLQDNITQLGLTFGRNVQEHVNTVQAYDISELDGLPADYLASHQPGADGIITLTTDYPDYQPVLTFATNEGLRRRMFLAYNTRAFPANTPVLMELLETRQELATTLGFSTWADLATADQMVASAAKVKQFLAQLDEASKAGAAQEYSMVLAFARKQKPGLASIDAASAAYWYEQYRRAAFDFDSQSVRPYFPYEKVQQGVLDTAARLFHVEFRPAGDAVVWDGSVTAWDVYDRSPKNSQGAHRDARIGRFYLDMHPREGKDKWFSAFPLVPGIRGQQIPEAALICNFPGGVPGANSQPGANSESKDPGLMQYSDVVTFFHEFGHLMHAILGGQQAWAGVSGIATEGDFVEAPSQMLEEFFRDPALLQSFALHCQTGQPIPAELVERMNRASAFGRGNWVRGQLFYTRFALDLHDRPPASVDLDALMRADYAGALPYTWIEGNRFYASFTHLVGYSSNYYTYLFDKVIALDFFRQFDRHNLIEGPSALRYREQVLEPGGSQPGSELVRNFLGREQDLTALEDWMNEEFASRRTNGQIEVGQLL